MATYTTTQTEPSSSAASTFELQSLPKEPRGSDSAKRLGISDLEDIRNSQAQPPSNAVEALQRWNSPKINMWRVFATFWSFFMLGMNDGSYGALVPYVRFPALLFHLMVPRRGELMEVQI